MIYISPLKSHSYCKRLREKKTDRGRKIEKRGQRETGRKKCLVREDTDKDGEKEGEEGRKRKERSERKKETERQRETDR